MGKSHLLPCRFCHKESLWWPSGCSCKSSLHYGWPHRRVYCCTFAVWGQQWRLHHPTRTRVWVGGPNIHLKELKQKKGDTQYQRIKPRLNCCAISQFPKKNYSFELAILCCSHSSPSVRCRFWCCPTGQTPCCSHTEQPRRVLARCVGYHLVKEEEMIFVGGKEK